MKRTSFFDSARIAAGGLKDFASGLGTPSLRLGVTGLARSGKTVFITALVHALLNQTRLPLFDAQAQGRITRAYLEPQPDDDLPRFAYEDHLARLTADDRQWPESTRRLSQLRLTVDYTPQGFIARRFGRHRLHVDIVDYPGEWLLDLPLLGLSYEQWSAETVAASRLAPRQALARDWHSFLATLDPLAPADEQHAVKAAELFTSYLARCRGGDVSLSALPPGRFLMPGDLAGSPLLTFAPLDVAADADLPRGSLGALMARRYDSYAAKVVKPFFFGHFARLDCQIVLVDALTALNAGADAMRDLQKALGDVLQAFRQGSNSWASAMFGRRIERIVFAAAKADLIHHTSHDRLEAILDLIVKDAAARAEYFGADIDIAGLAAIRATREATVKQKGEELACIVGIPQQGETIGGQVFNGETEAAIFPGDLPADPQEALRGGLEGALHFVKFRPPLTVGKSFPHIRLDRTLEFLLGDRFQ
ncbi:YcjX family protein [Phyllobacteriaceae bacterium SYSU D60012]|uniref:YcjX family protein n=1 Tax=Taklimakanibacter lacteus TaxID=2268456 RepID=UPI000E665FBA